MSKISFLGRKKFPMRITSDCEIVENGTVPQKLFPFDVLTNVFEKNGKYYQLTTYVLSTEISHLIIKVFITEACILSLLFATIIYINRKTSAACGCLPAHHEKHW